MSAPRGVRPLPTERSICETGGSPLTGSLGVTVCRDQSYQLSHHETDLVVSRPEVHDVSSNSAWPLPNLPGDGTRYHCPNVDTAFRSAP
jgi:hypothetical protein